MDNIPLGLTGFGFWLAIALIVIAIVWAVVKKQQMKHELTLKLLEKGQGVDQALLEKLLASGRPEVRAQPKSIAEEHLNGGSFMTLLFVVPGLIMMAVGALREDGGPNWLLIALGAFAFVYGNLCWRGAYKRYLVEKAEEKAEAKLSGN
jgi:hypothetical protein